MRPSSTLLALALLAGAANAGAQEGERIYNRACAACHLDNGRGAQGIAPPLQGSVGCLAARADDRGREYLIGVLEYGLEGPIKVGETQLDGFMPPLPQLSAADKAAVLNYVISLEGPCREKAREFSPEEIGAARHDAGASPQSMLRLREELTQAPAASEATPPTREPAPTAGLPVPAVSEAIAARAALDFARQCRGCHTPSGEQVGSSVPALKGQIGLFLHSKEGRAFLVRVPGVAFAPLDDGRLADLLNWMVTSLSPEQLPPSFVPYTAAEVASHRAHASLDAASERASIVAQLSRQGLWRPKN